jgi:SAM-dependent methyltransferase
MLASMDPVHTYDAHAARLAKDYESVAADAVHADLKEFILSGPDRVALDIGAGSGRDAEWLVSKGYEVIAVEPSSEMRREGQRLHPSTRIYWLDDRLPGIPRVHERGIAYDLILLSAVWMHIPPADRERAFRKIVTLLKPGGVLLMTLREGPIDRERSVWPAPLGEVQSFARTHGLTLLKTSQTPDRLARREVSWISVALTLPDDGSGALPLLRGIILKDDKSSTYKLGLLRAIARIADSMPSLARLQPDSDQVTLPLGAIAMVWVRMYLPLVAKRLPQMPRNDGPDGLGFAKAGFRALLERGFVAQDLRVGARFDLATGLDVARAFAESADLITKMPAHHITYPASGIQVFIADRSRLPQRFAAEAIDRPFLEQFGSLTVPGSVWRALTTLGSWVEPVLVSEWSRMVLSYSGSRASSGVSAAVTESLTWIDPERDTRFARMHVERLRNEGHPIGCVWSGSPLAPMSTDIDHCLPWSAWPCNDLWNLLPTTASVNRSQKRERLPSVARLADARQRIIRWWELAWLSDPGLGDRFAREAEAALPGVAVPTPEGIFEGLEWRRLRLRTEQQVPEWGR